MTKSGFRSLSLVVPVYMGAPFLAEITERVLETARRMNLAAEIIYVCDASPDESWSEICRLAERHAEVRGIAFTRNLGQHTAISAGIDAAHRELVAVMDCDLQDSPEDLELLVSALGGPNKIAAAAPPRRGSDAGLYRIARGAYHRTHRMSNRLSTDLRSMSFVVMTQEVARTLRLYREADRHFSGLILDAGYAITFVTTEFHDRPQGKSSYTLRKRVRLAVSGLLFHSTFWISVAVAIGAATSALAFVTGFALTIARLSGATIEAGWTSTITLILFALGVIVFGMGILGLYLNQVLAEVRGRPMYVIDRSINLPRHEAAG